MFSVYSLVRAVLYYVIWNVCIERELDCCWLLILVWKAENNMKKNCWQTKFLFGFQWWKVHRKTMMDDTFFCWQRKSNNQSVTETTNWSLNCRRPVCYKCISLLSIDAFIMDDVCVIGHIILDGHCPTTLSCHTNTLVHQLPPSPKTNKERRQ